MTAILTYRAALFLRRAGLLAGLLAVIAAIVGMHVLTGPHNMPMAGSITASMTHHPGHTQHMAAENSGHDSHGQAPKVTAGVISPGSLSPASEALSCMGGDPCAGMSAMGGSCIPSGSTGSLAAPPPSTVSFAADIQAPEIVVSSYAYLPESPSPTDLCISRT